jgi:hypothetical protein
LEVSLFCRYFAPAIEEQRVVKTLPESSKIRFSESFLKKVFEKFGRLKNLPYLCTTFALRNVGNGRARAANKVLKNFLKKVSKKFGGLKKTPYLCTTFALIKQPRCKTEDSGNGPIK